MIRLIRKIKKKIFEKELEKMFESRDTLVNIYEDSYGEIWYIKFTKDLNG